MMETRFFSVMCTTLYKYYETSNSNFPTLTQLKTLLHCPYCTVLSSRFNSLNVNQISNSSSGYATVSAHMQTILLTQSWRGGWVSLCSGKFTKKQNSFKLLLITLFIIIVMYYFLLFSEIIFIVLIIYMQ